MKAVEHSRAGWGVVAGAWLSVVAGGCALNFGLEPVDRPEVDTSEDTQSDPDITDDGHDTDAIDSADPDALDTDGFDTEDPDLDTADPTDPPVDDTAVEDLPPEEVTDPYDPIPHYTVTLREAVEGIPISNDPATLAVPDATRRNRWSYFLDDLLSGNYSGAYSRSITYEIEVFAVTDTTAPGRDYLVAYDPNQGEGIYVFSVTPGHPLVVEVPYPVDDVGTLSEGIEILRQADGWALLVAGTTRCARPDTVICDGTTIACDATPARFRYSDVAHQPNLIFQTIHNYLSAEDATSKAVQVQGQVDSSAAYAIVTDGTSIADLTSISVSLRNLLRAGSLPALYETDIMSCNDSGDAAGYVSTCQTTNVQGRSSNGSASPCNTAATTSSNRFVVLELSSELRDETVFTAMANAIHGLF